MAAPSGPWRCVRWCVSRRSASGAQETQQQIKAVGEAATQTARALELMAQAAAKESGGTAQQWVEIFQRGGVQPHAAAMADAAKSMQQTTAAATQAVAPTQAVARAADDMQKGLQPVRLNHSSDGRRTYRHQPRALDRSNLRPPLS